LLSPRLAKVLQTIPPAVPKIDTAKSSTKLYSLACPLYAGLFVVAIPKLTKGALELVAKKKDGTPLET